MLHGVDVYYTLFPSKSVMMSTNFVFYSGPNLPFTGTNNKDNLTLALQKIELKLAPSELLTSIISEIVANPTLRAQLCSALGGCV